MAIYIQKIQSIWTKESRGNPGASLRNKVPEQLPIKGTDARTGMYLEEILYREHTAFQDPQVKAPKKINENQLRDLGLSVKEENAKLHIGFWKKENNPAKHPYGIGCFLKKSGELGHNNWCQLKTNRRYSLEHTWAYYKIVYNIFFGDLSKAREFMQSQPMQFYQDYQTLLK